MARTTKLTPKVQRTIVDAIAAGNYASVACRLANVSEATFHEWIARGRGNDPDRPRTPLHAGFAEAVERAEAEAEAHAVALVRASMPDNWAAAMTYLERRYRDRWRRSEAREHTGAEGGPITTRIVIEYDDGPDAGDVGEGE